MRLSDSENNSKIYNFIVCSVGFYRNVDVSLYFRYPRFDQSKSYLIIVTAAYRENN